VLAAQRSGALTGFCKKFISRNQMVVLKSQRMKVHGLRNILSLFQAQHVLTE